MFKNLKVYLKEDRFFVGGACVFLMVSGLYVLLNFALTHYQGCYYQLRTVIEYLPWGFGMLCIGIYLKPLSQRFSLLFNTVAKLYMLYLVYAVGCYAIQFTPFRLIDTFLLHFDQSVGFSSKAVYQFTMSHPMLKAVASFAYHSLSYFFLIPLILALLLEKKSLRVFFLSNVISAFIAYNIYYFLPTTVPAHVVSAHFTNRQYMVVAQWYEIHLHLKQYIRVGDLIGFPSYHVIWSLLFTYACRNRRWLFYPVLLLTFLLIMSTMQLGWHFLADVLGGVLVCAVSVSIAELFYAKRFSWRRKPAKALPLMTTRQFCEGLNR